LETRQWGQSVADINEHSRSLVESLTSEAKERMANDIELNKIASQTKTQIEKEIADRKLADEEAYRRSVELEAGLTQERCDRDRDDTALKTLVLGAKQDISVEKQERCAEMISCKTMLQALEHQILDQVQTIHQQLSAETEERSSANSRVERQHSEFKVAMEVDRANIEMQLVTLEVGLRSNKQALDQEKKDVAAILNEMNEKLADTTTQITTCCSDLNNERADRGQEDAALRALLQSLDRNVLLKFQDVDDNFKTEAAERKDRDCKLEKRFAELRGAVLIAVRGNRPGDKLLSAS